MSTTTEKALTAKRRKRELVFFAFSAGVFTFSMTALGAICVVCAHPATVALAH